jgi:hypothetical protein
VILGGLHPGQSTNATSVLVAEKVKAQIFVNATDVGFMILIQISIYTQRFSRGLPLINA